MKGKILAVDEKQAILTPPNALSLARLSVAPALPAAASAWGLGAGLFLLVALAAATDVADGFLARRRNQVTAAGHLLDPLADKALAAAALWTLAGTGAVPAWLFWLYAAKESLQVLIAPLAWRRCRGRVQPCWWARLGTATLFAGAALGLGGAGAGGGAPGGRGADVMGIVAAGVALSVAAGFHYLRQVLAAR